MEWKREVDHVAGTVKTMFQRETAIKEILFDCDHTVSFLKVKFSDNDDPHYVIKGKELRKVIFNINNTKLKIYKHVDGSAKLHVVGFKSNLNSFKGADSLYICDECGISDDFCSVFQKYQLNIDDLEFSYLLFH